MLKVKIVGDSFALLSGGSETGEGGAIALSLPAGDTVASVSVNGRAFPVSGGVARLSVTAFRTGVNRIALRREDGRTLPAEGIRLTGGLFSPAGAELSDVIAAFDSRFAEFARAQAELSARVTDLENDFGILP